MKRLALLAVFVVLLVPLGHRHPKPHRVQPQVECLDIGFYEDGTPIIPC